MPIYQEQENVDEQKTSPSFLCNLFGCKEKNREIAPNYFIVECSRCKEVISHYFTFELGSYRQN